MLGFRRVLVIQMEKLKALRVDQARIQEKCLGWNLSFRLISMDLAFEATDLDRWLRSDCD